MASHGGRRSSSRVELAGSPKATGRQLGFSYLAIRQRSKYQTVWWRAPYSLARGSRPARTHRCPLAYASIHPELRNKFALSTRPLKTRSSSTVHRTTLLRAFQHVGGRCVSIQMALQVGCKMANKHLI